MTPRRRGGRDGFGKGFWEKRAKRTGDAEEFGEEARAGDEGGKEATVKTRRERTRVVAVEDGLGDGEEVGVTNTTGTGGFAAAALEATV